VFRRKDGKIESHWESEEVIQATARNAGVVLPNAPVFHERPLLVLDPRYSARLIAEARKQNVPVKDAVPVIEAHIARVERGEAKMATKWSELVASAAPNVPPATSPAAIPPTSPSPVKIPETSAQKGNRRSPIWFWAAGATVLLATIAFWLKRGAPPSQR
jgi:hypothetical protein